MQHPSESITRSSCVERGHHVCENTTPRSEEKHDNRKRPKALTRSVENPINTRSPREESRGAQTRRVRHVNFLLAPHRRHRVFNVPQKPFPEPVPEPIHSTPHLCLCRIAAPG